MKVLSITAILLMLEAAPAYAGLLTIENGDLATQCGLTAAHLITNGSESSRLFPDDNSACAELGDDAGSESNVDVLRAQPAAVRAQVEPILEIATLPHSAND